MFTFIYLYLFCFGSCIAEPTIRSSKKLFNTSLFSLSQSDPRRAIPQIFSSELHFSQLIPGKSKNVCCQKVSDSFFISSRCVFPPPANRVQTCFSHWVGHATGRIALAWPEWYQLRDLWNSQYSCGSDRCPTAAWLHGKKLRCFNSKEKVTRGL